MRKMESYDNSVASTNDLPFGSFADESSSGANDGTSIVAAHMQDLYYSLYQILQLAGVVPNGKLENGNDSKQFISALSNITQLLYNTSSVYNKNAICFNIFNNSISVYMSAKDNNTSSLSNSADWKLLYTISESGVFQNMNLFSPALTGIPTAPTASNGTANTQIANTAFVKNSFKDFIKITTGKNTNGATITPPSGFTMSNLVAFIPAVSDIYYSGDVDGNDYTHCNYTIRANDILLTVYSSEQRAATYANWIAIWIK